MLATLIIINNLRSISTYLFSIIILIMIEKSDIKLIKNIIEFINSNDKYNRLFKHHKQVYSIEDLLTALIYKLKTEISYKNISNQKFNIKGYLLVSEKFIFLYIVHII